MIDVIRRVIDWFYFKPIAKILSLQLFRYGATGGANLLLNWVLYIATFHFIVAKNFIDLGFVVISPHIASFLIVFPITLFTGFWLQKNITFSHSTLKNKTQWIRYFSVVCGAIIINYVGLKLMVDIWGFYPSPSQIAVSIITVIYSYTLQRYFTFQI